MDNQILLVQRKKENHQHRWSTLLELIWFVKHSPSLERIGSTRSSPPSPSPSQRRHKTTPMMILLTHHTSRISKRMQCHITYILTSTPTQVRIRRLGIKPSRMTWYDTYMCIRRHLIITVRSASTSNHKTSRKVGCYIDEMDFPSVLCSTRNSPSLIPRNLDI